MAFHLFSTRQATLWLLALLLVPWSFAQSEEEDPFAKLIEQEIQESMAVRRVVIDARVLDKSGAPVIDLHSADFYIEAGSEQWPLTSCRWVSAANDPVANGEIVGTDPALDDDAFWQDQPMDTPQPTPGQLVIFFMQGDVLSERRHGLLRMTRMAERILAEMSPHDFCAVVSFFSHFKIHQDFTRNRSLIKQALQDGLFNREVDYGESGSFPSLTAQIDAFESRDIATPEDAFYLIGDGLAGFEGNKSIIYLGWGLGRHSKGGVTMTPNYKPAMRRLSEARATVFAMDVTLADWHSLETGMKQAASHTGGFYVKTHQFANQAITRVLHAMSGYYELSFSPPTRETSLKNVRLKVRRKGLQIHTTPSTLW